MLCRPGTGKGYKFYSIVLHNVVLLFNFIEVLEFLARRLSFHLLKAAVEGVDRFCFYDILVRQTQKVLVVSHACCPVSEQTYL